MTRAAPINPTPDRPWLIVAAIRAEARALLPGGDSPSAVRGWPLYHAGETIDVVISGLGRANAAGAVVFAAQTRNYGLILNVGVAGALPSSGLCVGDSLCATESIFCEEGIELPGGVKDISGIGFSLAAGEWIMGNRLVHDRAIVQPLADRIPGAVHQAPIATVARCSGSDAAARRVARETGAAAEAMEGAAVALAARRMGVPPAEIRVISNTCGDRRHQRWDLPAAFAKLDVILHALTA